MPVPDMTEELKPDAEAKLTPEQLHEEIEKLAYYLYLNRSGDNNTALSDWLRAEHWILHGGCL